MFSLFTKFKEGLQKTATVISRKVSQIFSGTTVWDEKTFAELERSLIESDLGVEAARAIVADIRSRYELGKIGTEEDFRQVASQSLQDILNKDLRSIRKNPDGLTVVLFLGVNGSGKTTSIGKLANLLHKQGKKVTLAACDTFRAAAVEQLQLWADRTGSAIVSSKAGADPASVAFDAVKSAMAKGADYLLIDTAGRQQNHKNLMDELSKICRIVGKVMPGAPHETILTIDASLGTNALSQAQEFASAAGASALVVTKLDGTGKGGAACAVLQKFHLPILYVGLGEGEDDLQEFSPKEYADAFFDLKETADQEQN